jgi:hypothetical protein
VSELRITRGAPTAAETAAVVAVLLGLGRPAATGGAAVPQSRWRTAARPAAGRRPGPGAWRASALP